MHLHAYIHTLYTHILTHTFNFSRFAWVSLKAKSISLNLLCSVCSHWLSWTHVVPFLSLEALDLDDLILKIEQGRTEQLQVEGRKEADVR